MEEFILAELRKITNEIKGLRDDMKIRATSLIHQRVDSAVYGPCGIPVDLKDSEQIKDLLRVAKLNQGEVI